MPSVSVKRVLNAPVEEVWAVISDIENAKGWNAAWDSIEITSPQRHGLGTTFRARMEDGTTFEFEIVEWANNERLTIAPVRDPGERYELMLEEQGFTLRGTPDGGTLVELKSVASAHGLRGRIYGLFFWGGHQAPGLNEALDAIEDIVDPPTEEEVDETAVPAED